jgi:hypothetical protein
MEEVEFWNLFSGMMMIGGAFFYLVLFAVLLVIYGEPMKHEIWWLVFLMCSQLFYAIPLIMTSKMLKDGNGK